VALVKAECADDISNRIATGYKEKTGIDGAIFASRPAAGAAIIKR
jgi:hypothetical protein